MPYGTVNRDCLAKESQNSGKYINWRNHNCLLCCFEKGSVCYWLETETGRSWTTKHSPTKKKEKESKKHLSLKIFWFIARASLFSYLSYCVRQSKEYVRRYLIVIWSHMKVCPKIWSHKRLAQAAGQKCKNVISLAIDRYMV